jgi:hypothetical protein
MMMFMQREEILKILKDIIFPIKFPGDNTQTKISDTVPHLKSIKQEIERTFNITLNCDISSLSINELCEIIFKANRWTLRQVCGYILKSLGTRGPLGRQIGHAEKFKDLRFEATKANKKNEFDDAFRDVLNYFGVTIDTQTLRNDTKIYNIGNMLTNLLVDKGMAISFEEEYQDVDLFFAPIHIATAFNCLTGILKNHFEFWAPKGEETKKLRRTLLGFKSYDEYNQFMVKEGIKVKVDKIIYEYSNLNCPFELRPNMSNFVIFPWNAYGIKQDIEAGFNISVDYNISGTRANELYTYVYDQIKDSPISCDNLFKRMTSKSSENVVYNHKQTGAGLCENLGIDIADMYPPWAALNKASDSGFFYDIWCNMNLKIPDNRLLNCETFDEYKLLIIDALHKSFDGTGLDVDKEILQPRLTFVQCKQLFKR